MIVGDQSDALESGVSQASSPRTLPEKNQQLAKTTHSALPQEQMHNVVSPKVESVTPSHFPLFGLTIHHHSTNLNFPNENETHLLGKLKELCGMEMESPVAQNSMELDERLRDDQDAQCKIKNATVPQPRERGTCNNSNSHIVELQSVENKQTDKKKQEHTPNAVKQDTDVDKSNLDSLAINIPVTQHHSETAFIEDYAREQVVEFIQYYETHYLKALRDLWDDYDEMREHVTREYHNRDVPRDVKSNSSTNTAQEDNSSLSSAQKSSLPSALSNSYSTHIIPSILECRSIFTWLIHKLTQMKKLRKEPRQRMERVISILIEYARRIMEERLNKRKSTKHSKMSLNIFSEDINLETDQRIPGLNFNDFLENIGDEYRYSFSWFYHVMVATTAAFSRCDGKVASLPSKLMFGGYQAYYMLRPKLAAAHLSRFFKHVTLEQGRTLWNLQDDPMFRVFLFSFFPHIEYSSVFSIPSFTYEDLMKRPVQKHFLEAHVYEDEDESEEDYQNSQANPVAKPHQKEPKREPNTVSISADESPIVVESVNLLTQDEISETSPVNQEEIELIELKHVHKKKKARSLNQEHEFAPISDFGGISLEEFYHYRKQLHMPLASYNRQNIEIRLLYHGSNTHLKEYNFGTSRRDYPLLSTLLCPFHMFTDKGPLKDDMDGNILIQIHGGGFLAMSTFAHENYLRELCRETNLPVFSIEYTTAPDERCPAQIEQCFHAYKWIMQHAEDYLGVPLKNVFLTGDSAGGNLSCVTTIRCIEENIRVPDGLILTYPATNVSSTPSPARMLSLFDPLVNLSFMKLCSKYYPHKSANLKRDPFISPVFVSDKILAQFPPCFISVGSLDPLYDDTVMLAERLTVLNGHENVCLHVWDGLGHGYMNTIDFVGEASLIIKDYSRWVEGMILKNRYDKESDGEDAESLDMLPSSSEKGAEV
eukprot:CAMPEP_0117451128 /NCGR_PEP_ID=MMETSP0759-20121206/8841_1 /TAXON_ID=63605 /ORGANISM="Percolomonas cosmopolitus, Strain WS" /LENGTH=935 /DNA_ID=CAMNT_0005243705 /DNA_START=40 /DNA_END=2847 /DNA_ORIENTATION=-